jgi:hypothetical protein
VTGGYAAPQVANKANMPKVTRSGPASVRTTCLVSVSVDNELEHRGIMKKQIVVEDSLEVAQVALRNCEMKFMGVVHVEAHLLDHVRDVRHGEGEVLENLGRLR